MSETAAFSDSVERIDLLLHELEQLALRDVPADGFFAELLDRLLAVSGGYAAGVWSSGPDGTWLLWQERSRDDQRLSQHAARLQSLLGPATVKESGASVLACDPEPPGHLLCCAVRVADRPWVLLGLGVSPDVSQPQLRGCLQLVEAFAEVAAEFGQQRSMRTHAALLDELKSALTMSLHLQQARTAGELEYALVNDARAVLRVDRASLARPAGGHVVMTAISGVPHFESRAPTLVALTQLIQAWLRDPRPWISPRDEAGLDEHVRQPFAAYQAETNMRSVALIPLVIDAPSGIPRAILVLEDAGEWDLEALTRRLNATVPLMSSAVERQAALTRVPLVSSIRDTIRARRGWRLIAATIGVLVLLISGCLLSREFELKVHGELQPQLDRHVFAPRDATVAELFVRQGDLVDAGDKLVRLESHDLQLELERITGDLDESRIQRDRLQFELAASRRGDREPSLENRLAAQIEELSVLIESLEEQHRLIRDQVARLLVVSPIKGRVVTSDLKRRLEARPVSQGDMLLRVVDEAGPWELDLEVPDREIQHLITARGTRALGPTLHFALATQPDRSHDGIVREVGQETQPNAKSEPVVSVTADIESPEPLEKRIGAAVVARIHCGRRSYFYVYTRELREAFQRRWFW